MPSKQIGSCSDHIGNSRSSRWITHCNEQAYAYIEHVMDDLPNGFVLVINQHKDKHHYRHDSYTKPRTYTVIELLWDEDNLDIVDEWVTGIASNCELLLEQFALAMENIAPSEVMWEMDHDFWCSSREAPGT